MDLLLAGVIVTAVIFAGSNGFHDAALTIGNAVVGRSINPRWALGLAVVFNFIGALLGEGIASVVANQIVHFDGDPEVILTSLIIAFVAATAWSLFTYYLALPVSSTHCLIGGLLGAGIVLGFTVNSAEALNSVILPLVISPILGFVLSWGLTALLSKTFAASPPKPLFRGARMVDSVLTASLSLVHGVQDAQKIAALVMVGLLAVDANPYTELSVIEISWPVRLLIAAALAIGTGLSGWRVVRTLSVRMAGLDPLKSAAADGTRRGISVHGGTHHAGAGVADLHPRIGDSGHSVRRTQRTCPRPFHPARRRGLGADHPRGRGIGDLHRPGGQALRRIRASLSWRGVSLPAEDDSGRDHGYREDEVKPSCRRC